jgi:hypothetical protein
MQLLNRSPQLSYFVISNNGIVHFPIEDLNSYLMRGEVPKVSLYHLLCICIIWPVARDTLVRAMRIFITSLSRNLRTLFCIQHRNIQLASQLNRDGRPLASFPGGHLS